MFFLFSCKEPVGEEFAGKWEAGDGAVIVLNEDSTCIVRNLDPAKIRVSKNDSATKERINGAGKWELIRPNKYSGHYCIYIDSNKGGFPLCVMGTGLTGYFRPWKLCIYIGDPDDMNLYEFYKK
ncbi:MAG: hypothetical protein LBP64_01365 [Tannerella sp.]|jgi:hypothetical protein|nr:hypothetical protein [Tannerella sp.]